jgi:G3E family GTPase
VKTPVSLVTGYLGSGKTTLISQLLSHPAMGETAVIVNEIGEIGIDHHILSRVDENTVLLASGCLCCTLRGDLVDELRSLIDRRDAGEIPAFRRVVVETTGLADPTPIVNTLVAHPMLRHQTVLDSIVATVDAMHGLRGPESVKQAAVADVLVVTKVDLADGARVEVELGRLNPSGEIVEAAHGRVEPTLLFGRPYHDPRSTTGAENARVDSTQAGVPGTAKHDHGHGDGHSSRHESDVTAHVVVLARPVDWIAFGIWLTMLLHARGEEILRVKGLLDVGGEGPLLVNAVQHVVHTPEHLPVWPDDDRRSRLVFIGRGFTGAQLEESLRAFDHAARAG